MVILVKSIREAVDTRWHVATLNDVGLVAGIVKAEPETFQKAGEAEDGGDVVGPGQESREGQFGCAASIFIQQVTADEASRRRNLALRPRVDATESDFFDDDVDLQPLPHVARKRAVESPCVNDGFPCRREHAVLLAQADQPLEPDDGEGESTEAGIDHLVCGEV